MRRAREVLNVPGGKETTERRQAVVRLEVLFKINKPLVGMTILFILPMGVLIVVNPVYGESTKNVVGFFFQLLKAKFFF